jgi:glycosyltransferase involved in cell wall biosynthesis
LHGVERLAQAIGLLRHRDDIEFQIVGDGQSAEAFARALASGPRVRWDRGWKSAAEIAQLIRDADICLGIFGETPKARRVWPLKNYCYMAVGRALVTSAAYGLPQGLPAVEGVEFVAAGADGGRQLADAILRLADDPVLRQRLAREAADYFEAHLDGAEALRRLCTAFCELSAQGRSRRDFAP